MAYLRPPPMWDGDKFSPSRSAIVPSILGILLLYNLAFRLRRWYRLRQVPGPLICGFTSLPLSYHHWYGDVAMWVKKLTDEHGSVVRIGPNEVVCIDLEELHRISGPKSQYRKDKWHLIGRMTPGQDSVFSMLEPERRRERRKMVAPAYAARGTDGFEEGADRGIVRWIEALDSRYASTGKSVDLTRETHFATLDTLGEVAYSQELGFLKNNRDMGDFLKINERMLPVVAALNNYTSFFMAMNLWPLNLLLPRAGDSAGLGAIIGFTAGIIDERLRPDAKPKRDMLQSFISSGLGRTELLQEVSLQFFAGSDTTANAITILLAQLITNPPAYRKLQCELDDASACGQASTPIRDSEAKSLPYLQACVREVLRTMAPLTSGGFYKAVPRGGDTLCGRFLPYGTRINTSGILYAMGRDQRVWGEDADHFYPDRWLDPELSEEKRQVMIKTVDLAFGYGQFACLGKAFALMEIGKAVAECIRHYDLSLVDFPLKSPTLRGAIAWMVHDFHVRIDRRK